MTVWPDDLDITAGRHGDDEMSALAHQTIVEDKSRLRRQVLAFIRDRPHCGATCEEVEDRLGLIHQTCSARISELRARGQLITVGDERRRTSTGRWARVHRARETADS